MKVWESMNYRINSQLNKRVKKNSCNLDKWIFVLISTIIVLFFLKVIQNLALTTNEINDKDYSQLEWENENYKDLGENPIVRVVLMTDGFKSIYHESVILSGTDLEIIGTANDTLMHRADTVEYLPTDDIFAQGTLSVESSEGLIQIDSIERSYGNPQYEGSVEIYSTDKGLVIVNELPLESYLRWVVPSEMPTSYEPEALKAQAVCARSYAYRQMQKLSYEEFNAHMDDSVNFQVYNNLNSSESSDAAIKATQGEKVSIDGKVVTTYFFSTSSGNTTDVRAWGSEQSEGNSYLKGIEVSDGENDFEKDLPWYSWSIKIGEDELGKILELNLDESIGTLENVEISKKGAGDIALELKVIGSDLELTIEGENSIRKVLGSQTYNIIKNDNSATKGMDLLPSAFFTLDKKDQEYWIEGGGLGHGIGMSQNGANEMAKKGLGYEEIINHFYQGVELMK